MACEKCWGKAYQMARTDPRFNSQHEAYEMLLTLPMTCTPEEKCGVGTTEMHTIHFGESQCACGLKKAIVAAHRKEK